MSRPAAIVVVGVLVGTVVVVVVVVVAVDVVVSAPRLLNAIAPFSATKFFSHNVE